MENNWVWWIVSIIIVLGALFAWPQINNPDKDKIARWEGLGVECLTNGHNNPAQHIHPQLQIIVNGQKQIIPKDIGIVKSCMAEIHTHDDAGEIHIESIYAGKQFSLQQFMDVWGESLEKDGYDLEMIVDGLPSVELGNLILLDKQQIILDYTKK